MSVCICASVASWYAYLANVYEGLSKNLMLDSLIHENVELLKFCSVVVKVRIFCRITWKHSVWRETLRFSISLFGTLEN